MTMSPPDGISASPVDPDNLLVWKALIRGPADTPYDGAYIHIRVEFPQDYPFSPPKLRILTPIEHVNFKSGFVCLDILVSAPDMKLMWSPTFKLSHVLLSVSSLLADCNPDHPFRPDLAQLYKTNRIAYDAHVRAFTLKYSCDPKVPDTLLLPYSLDQLPGAAAIAADAAATTAIALAAAATTKNKTK